MSNISGIRKLHFVGAGGISMSALAKLMIMMGKEVSGSDLVYNEEMSVLNQWGARIWVGHQPDRVVGADLVVYTLAVPETDPELCRARELNIPVVPRHDFLAEVSKNFSTVIAVSGTHGKTTTTGLIANILSEAGEAFTAHIGGNLENGAGNMIYKGYNFFVTEACEYRKSLLAIKPDIAVILNVERDHPDTFPTIEELYGTFDKFLDNLPKDGKAVVCGECEYYNNIKCANAHILSYGFEGDFTYIISDIEQYKNGYYRFLIKKNGEPEVRITLQIPGYHNIFNATAAYAAADCLNVDKAAIIKGIEEFKGMRRRFEHKGYINKCPIYIDYAHHPSEIKATIATALSMKPKRLVTVFQPHTYSRTKQLFEDFLTAFEGSDELYIFKEYAAREKGAQGKSAQELYAGLKAGGKKVYYFGNLLSLAESLSKGLKKDDMLLILGAGDIVILSELLIDIK